MWTPKGDTQTGCPRWELNPAFYFFLFKRLKTVSKILMDSEKKRKTPYFPQNKFPVFQFGQKGKETLTSLSQYPI